MYDESDSNNIQKNKRLLQTPSNPQILIRKSRELGWIWASSCRHTQQLLCKGFPWILSLEFFIIVFSCFFSLPTRDVEPSTHRCSAFSPVLTPMVQTSCRRFDPRWTKRLLFGVHCLLGTTPVLYSPGQVGDGLNLKGKATDQLTLKAKNTRYQVGA